jgi:hypothetical protein
MKYPVNFKGSNNRTLHIGLLGSWTFPSFGILNRINFKTWPISAVRCKNGNAHNQLRLLQRVQFDQWSSLRLAPYNRHNWVRAFQSLHLRMDAGPISETLFCSEYKATDKSPHMNRTCQVLNPSLLLSIIVPPMLHTQKSSWAPTIGSSEATVVRNSVRTHSYIYLIRGWYSSPIWGASTKGESHPTPATNLSGAGTIVPFEAAVPRNSVSAYYYS